MQLCVGGAIEPSSFTFLILLGKGRNTVKTCILSKNLLGTHPFFLSYVASGKDRALLISWSSSEWVVWFWFKLQLLQRWSVGLDRPCIKSEICSEWKLVSQRRYSSWNNRNTCLVAFHLMIFFFFFSPAGSCFLGLMMWIYGGAAFVESLIIPSGQSVWHSAVTFQSSPRNPPPPPKWGKTPCTPSKCKQTCLYRFSLFCC